MNRHPLYEKPSLRQCGQPVVRRPAGQHEDFGHHQGRDSVQGSDNAERLEARTAQFGLCHSCTSSRYGRPRVFLDLSTRTLYS
jgi:hypothetical protein